MALEEGYTDLKLLATVVKNLIEWKFTHSRVFSFYNKSLV